MKLIPNTDPYSIKYVSEGWASTGFGYKDDFDEHYESTETYGPSNFSYVYEVENSMYGKGGFTNILNLINNDRQTLLEKLNVFSRANFVDKQTRTLVVEAIFFNEYTDFFNNVHFVATF